MGPLERIIDEMNGCVAAGFPLVAISVAVALPSVCASTEMADGRALQAEYLNWCRANLYPNKGFDSISAEELYSIRNGFSHQGKSEILNNSKGKLTKPYQHGRVIFMLSEGIAWISCSNHLDDELVYQYSLEHFCKNMGAASLEWLSQNTANEIVQANLEKIATYRTFDGIKAIY